MKWQGPGTQRGSKELGCFSLGRCQICCLQALPFPLQAGQSPPLAFHSRTLQTVSPDGHWTRLRLLPAHFPFPD
ncbi:rCG37513 [Rattus norvegicus]|uniref:RCG37513 n=1 Tax=Rattus norvegicus TaxID=10116 RepID=A6KHP7_RAT|nr:rCG37513 [Rattus norvegicus]